MHNSLDGEAHAAIGNHDLVAAIPEDGSEPSDDPRRIFREKLGVARTYYSIDALGYHVMLLDSIQILGKDLLRKELGRSPDRLDAVVIDLAVSMGGIARPTVSFQAVSA